MIEWYLGTYIVSPLLVGTYMIYLKDVFFIVLGFKNAISFLVGNRSMVSRLLQWQCSWMCYCPEDIFDTLIKCSKLNNLTQPIFIPTHYRCLVFFKCLLTYSLCLQLALACSCCFYHAPKMFFKLIFLAIQVKWNPRSDCFDPSLPPPQLNSHLKNRGMGWEG